MLNTMATPYCVDMFVSVGLFEAMTYVHLGDAMTMTLLSAKDHGKSMWTSESQGQQLHGAPEIEELHVTL